MNHSSPGLPSPFKGLQYISMGHCQVNFLSLSSAGVLVCQLLCLCDQMPDHSNTEEDHGVRGTVHHHGEGMVLGARAACAHLSG